MSDIEKFQEFFAKFGIRSSVISPKDIVIEMDSDVQWAKALSVAHLWFLFGEDDRYLGLLNDETMEFEARDK